MTKANQVDQKTDKHAADIVALRGIVANIDDYKPVGDVTVLFPLNRATLSADDKAQLDMLAGSTSNLKKYFVAVEGFTDKTGPADYNLQLSQRRADAVVVYLASTEEHSLLPNPHGGSGRRAARRSCEYACGAGQESPRRSEGLQRGPGHGAGQVAAGSDLDRL